MKPRQTIVNIVIGVLAICCPPMLLLLQSNQGNFAGPITPERTDDEIAYEEAREWSIWAKEGHSSNLINLSNYYCQYGREKTADAWLRYGAIQLRSPALKLYYADYLYQRNQKRDRGLAFILYKQALLLGEQNHQKDFANAVRQRLANYQQEQRP